MPSNITHLEVEVGSSGYILPCKVAKWKQFNFACLKCSCKLILPFFFLKEIERLRGEHRQVGFVM